MPEKEPVYLDAIDGFEFQRICKRILERKYNCGVEETPPVGDEGRDLIVHSPKGTIVVECKHQPDTSIGRPVIQKLHSAVVSSGSVHGMLITTGTISKTAYEYVERLGRMGVLIEPIDRPLLAEMAAHAGITFVIDGKHVPVWSFEVSGKDSLGASIAAYLDGLYVSEPNRPSQLLKIHSRDIDLIPAYEVTYDINAVFETSVGVVHNEIMWDGRFFLNGENGNLLAQDLMSFFSRMPMKSYPVVVVGEWHPAARPFNLGVVPTKALASCEIIRRHTRSVTYSGRNNQNYTKLCEPNSRQFTIKSLRQMYLPVSTSRIQLIREHEFTYIEHPGAPIKMLRGSLLRCGICGHEVPNKPYLCNACGSPIHAKKILHSHSYLCADCGMTLCRSCAKYVRKYLVIAKPLCGPCSRKYPVGKLRDYPRLAS